MEKWTNERTLHFINAIHMRPELWDVENIVYRDRSQKKDSWQAVADEYAITPDEAYKKFRSLRTYAKCEEKKLHKKSGSAAGTSSASTWFAYDAMSFILSRDVPEAGFDNESSTAETLLETEMSQDEINGTLDTGPQQISTPLKLVQAKQINPLTEEQRLAVDRAVAIINNAVQKRPNPYSAYGEHIANKLLRYSDLIRSEVELKISKVLYEADMKMLQSRPSAIDYSLHTPEIVLSESSSEPQYNAHEELSDDDQQKKQRRVSGTVVLHMGNKRL